MVAPIVVVAMRTLGRELDRLWEGTSDLQPHNWGDSEKKEFEQEKTVLGKAWVWVKHFGEM